MNNNVLVLMTVLAIIVEAVLVVVLLYCISGLVLKNYFKHKSQFIRGLSNDENKGEKNG